MKKSFKTLILALTLIIILATTASAAGRITGMQVAQVGDSISAGEGAMSCESKGKITVRGEGSADAYVDITPTGYDGTKIAYDQAKNSATSQCNKFCGTGCQTVLDGSYQSKTIKPELIEGIRSGISTIEGVYQGTCTCKNPPTPEEIKEEAREKRCANLPQLIKEAQARLNYINSPKYLDDEYKKLMVFPFGPDQTGAEHIDLRREGERQRAEEDLKRLQIEYQKNCQPKETSRIPGFEEQEGIKIGDVPLLTPRRDLCSEDSSSGCQNAKVGTPCGVILPSGKLAGICVKRPASNTCTCEIIPKFYDEREPGKDTPPRIYTPETYGTNPEFFQPQINPPPSDPVIKYPLSGQRVDSGEYIKESMKESEKYEPREPASIITEGELDAEQKIKEFEEQDKQENIIQKTWKWIKRLFGAGGIALPEDFDDLPEPAKERIKEFFKQKKVGSLIKFDASQDLATEYSGDGNVFAIAITGVPKGRCVTNNCELQVTLKDGQVIPITVNLQAGSELLEMDINKIKLEGLPKDAVKKIEIVKPGERVPIDITSISLVEKGGEPDEDITNVRLIDTDKYTWSDIEDEYKTTDTLISSVPLDKIVKFKLTTASDEELKIIKKDIPPLPPTPPTGITIGEFKVAVRDELPEVFDIAVNNPDSIKQIKIGGKEIGKDKIKKTIRICIGDEFNGVTSITEPESDNLALVTDWDQPIKPGQTVILPPRTRATPGKDNGVIAQSHYNTVSLVEDYPTKPPRKTNTPTGITASAVKITGRDVATVGDPIDAGEGKVGCNSKSGKISSNYGNGMDLIYVEKIIPELRRRFDPQCKQKCSANCNSQVSNINYDSTYLSYNSEYGNELVKDFSSNVIGIVYVDGTADCKCTEKPKETSMLPQEVEVVRVPCDVVIPAKDKEKIKDIFITREEDDATPKIPCDQRRCDPNRSYSTPEQDPCKGCGTCRDGGYCSTKQTQILVPQKKLCGSSSVPSCQGKNEGDDCKTEYHDGICEIANIMSRGGGETSGCICPAKPEEEKETGYTCPAPDMYVTENPQTGKLECYCINPNAQWNGKECVSQQGSCNHIKGSTYQNGLCVCPQGMFIYNNECARPPETGQRQTTTPPSSTATIGTPQQQTTTPPTSTTPKPPQTTTSTTTTSQPPSITPPTTQQPSQQTTTPPPAISPPTQQDDGMEVCPPAQMCPADFYANVLIGCYESYAGVSETCRQSIGLCSQCPQPKQDNYCANPQDPDLNDPDCGICWQNLAVGGSCAVTSDCETCGTTKIFNTDPRKCRLESYVKIRPECSQQDNNADMCPPGTQIIWDPNTGVRCI